MVVAYPTGDGAEVIGDADKLEDAEALGRAHEGIEFFRVYEAEAEYLTVQPDPSLGDYYLVQQDPSDPTAGGRLFEQTTAPGDTSCGTCKAPIAKGDQCYAIYVSSENRDLLGYRCTKRICRDGERIDKLPPGVDAEG